MPNSVDRQRLKDRIVDNISKAVKNVQNLCCSHQDGDHNLEEIVILRNGDWQFSKLVEHLDHAFMHGLRHVTNGYWAVVQEFTHQMTVMEINQLMQVTTNIGRSRAWLYQALSEHLLESYLRCYLDNATFIKKYYVHDALALDEQRLQILLTLSSGLDLVTFTLEINVPYLDLCSHQPVSVSMASDEDNDDSTETMSLSSAGSTQSSLLLILEQPVKLFNRLTSGHTASETVPSAQPVAAVQDSEDQNRPHCFPLILETELTSDSGKVEVEHFHTISKSSKQQKRGYHSRLSKQSDCEVLSKEGNSSTPESGYRSVVQDTSSEHETFDGISTSVVLCSPQSDRMKSLGDADEGLSTDEIIQKSSLLTLSFGIDEDVSTDREASLSPEIVSESVVDVTLKVSVVCAGPPSRHLTEDELLRSILDDHCHATNKTKLPQTHSSPDLENCFSEPAKSVSADEIDSSQSFDGIASGEAIAHSANNDNSIDNEASSLSCDSAVTDVCILSNPVAVIESVSSVSDVVPSALVDEPSIYDDFVGGASVGSVSRNSASGVDLAVVPENLCHYNTSSIDLACKLSSSCVSENKMERCQSGSSQVKRPESVSRLSRSSSLSSCLSIDVTPVHHMEVRLDNNLKLLLMLEVFQFDHEKFVKMFQVSVGHPEGKVRPVFLLITDLCLYQLSYCHSGETKYSREKIITFHELKYISLSLGSQWINIVAQSRNKQFWISTGDEQLSSCIVDAIDHAWLEKDPDRPKLSILTDATMQKISIKKFLAAECHTEMQDVQVLSYFVVYWENSESLTTSEMRINNGCKEGVLQFKTVNYLFGGTAVWSPAYFKLKNGILYQYDSKTDMDSSMAARSSYALSKDECCGCRRSRDSDRSHAFEIVFSNDSPLELAASNEVDVSEWLQAICHAVSKQKGVHRTKLGGCVACCCVISDSHIVLCHEDVETNVVRLLGSVTISSVLSVHIDPALETYCFLSFIRPSQKAPLREKWAIYFAASNECERFMTHLNNVYFELKKEKIIVEHVDVVTSKRCRAGTSKLYNILMP